MKFKKRIVALSLAFMALISGAFALTSCDGHDWEVFYDDTSCTQKGYITYICMDCGEMKTEHKNALGHKWETKTVEATCVTDGYTAKTCSRCKQEKDKTILSATGKHTYEETIVAPSCEDGYTLHECKYCGDSYITNSTAGTGHSFNENGICTKCGSPNLEFSDLYGVSAGGELSGDIIIPSTYRGTPVTKIDTFSGCSKITSVTIPDSVTEIEGQAFSDCTSLKSVTIGNGVTKIGLGAFSGCTSLKSITIPDSVTVIWQCAFSDCTSLTSVIFENTEGWKATGSYHKSFSSVELEDPAAAAEYLSKSYWRLCTWSRS